MRKLTIDLPDDVYEALQSRVEGSKDAQAVRDGASKACEYALRQDLDRPAPLVGRDEVVAVLQLAAESAVAYNGSRKDHGVHPAAGLTEALLAMVKLEVSLLRQGRRVP